MSVKSPSRRSPLKAVLAIAAVLALLEVGAYVFIVVLGKNYYLPLALDDLSEDAITDDMRSRFSAELGWKAAKSGSDVTDEAPEGAVMAVFGDEYTSGKSDKDEPWPDRLERRLGQPVLNLAVGAYGPGQAYLRYDRHYAEKLETPYLALVMMSGASARYVNRYRGFYARGTPVRYPKPMFGKNDDGVVELLPNPIGSADELVKLGDPSFLEELGEDDYWYDYFDEYGLNEQVGFPYAVSLAKAVPYYVKRWRDHSLTDRQSYQDVYQDDDATDVLRHIVQTFIDRAEEQGSVPIFVIVPNRADMANYLDQGATTYATIFEDLRSIDHPHIHDGLEFFQDELATGAGLDTFYRGKSDDSLTPEAEQLVADGMHGLLTSIDAEEKRLSPSITMSKAVH